MPRGSEELTDQRKKEIIRACGKLYKSRGFRDITIKDISVETTFSRPSIYNYFETKEEIFLALLTEEYAEWTRDLLKIAKGKEPVTGDALAEQIAGTLKKRTTLLKISAMNIYEIEENSRLERLVEFKKAFRDSMVAFTRCLELCPTSRGEARKEEIRYAFFPFMNGVYPYAYPTEKQRQAMDQAEVPYEVHSVYELTRQFLRQIL